jgi:hypothetical protein
MSCAEARRGWWRVGIEFRNLGLMDGLFIVVLLFSPIFSIIVSVLGTYFSQAFVVNYVLFFFFKWQNILLTSLHNTKRTP